ncbi:MAG: peptide-N-glycosidase [Flavobacteriia bacterium]|nr:MAG: peptide-N-glycosidase [Flavobacteriia bacterium]
MKNSYFQQGIFTLILFMIITLVQAQNPVEVIYHKTLKEKNKKPAAKFIFKDNVAYLSDNGDKNLAYIDYNTGEVINIIKLNDRFYKTVEKFASLPQPVLQNETEKILGYKCKKATFKAFSNTIEVWYTEKSKAKGSPYQSYLPKNGLVLKVKINGSQRMIATDIRKLPEDTVLFYPVAEAKEITKPELRELQIKSRYVSLPVFNKQQVNFDTKLKACSLDEKNKTYRCSNGTVILKKIELPEIARKGASVFATLTNWSNGDAYDRTCSLFTVSDTKEKTVLDAFKNGIKVLPVFKGRDGKEYQGIVSTSDYSVPVELMRFFTSFGVSHFNKKREINNYKWRDSVVYKEEITSLIPNTKKEIWIGVFIGNYDKGGHKVSLELDFYPAWEKEKEVEKKYINPLFSTLNILEMSGQNYGRLFKTDTLKTEFTVPENVKDLKLLYTSTGHGGWGGGDEFNQRLNKVYIDGKLIYNEVPWRTDCGTYRLSNPASGNFSNGLSSSDLSRSNWCPAMLTSPKVIHLKDLSPGKHTIQVVIEQGDDDGNSFNHWSVTGILTGSYKK